MSNQNNRVLNRIGARVLTPSEEAVVIGGRARGTDTVCTIAAKPDGDPGECQ